VGVSKGTTRESSADEEERAGGVRKRGAEGGGRGNIARGKVESKMVSKASSEVVRRYLVTCTLRGREREVGGEGAGRSTGKEGREGETGAEGRTLEAVETETEDEVEGGALDGKDKSWGAEAASNEVVTS